MALVLGLAGVVYSFRSDKTHVFAAMAGTLHGSRTIRSRDSESSIARLIEFSNERGEWVGSAWIRRPHELAPNYRTLVIYAGGNTKSDILNLIPERDDLVLASIQYPFEKPENPFAKLMLPVLVREAGFRTVASGMLAVDFLVDEMCVDPDRIVAVGVSLGSIFATIHAALDTRLAELVVIHGGGDFQAIVRAGAGRLRERGFPIAPALVLAWACADTFDPIHWVERVSPRRVTIIASAEDEVFPPESIEAVYDHAREPKQILWTKTEHVHAWKENLVAALVAQVEKSLDGLPID